MWMLYWTFIDCTDLCNWNATVLSTVTAMSLCDDTLLCNFPKCRTKLSGFAWVTACSHVFCDQHGSGEFSRSPAICPACSSALSGKLDIVRMELSPSEEYKAMVLAGLRPDMVLDISARALAFWSYQVKYLSVCIYIWTCSSVSAKQSQSGSYKTPSLLVSL